jgi:hypothetical protein
MPERHDQQGTGRHGHKDTQEPNPQTRSHAKNDDTRQGQSHGREHETAGTAHPQRRQDASESADLKNREYRGDDGETHHHTRTYMEQHRGEHASGEHDSSKSDPDRRR